MNETMIVFIYRDEWSPAAVASRSSLLPWALVRQQGAASAAEVMDRQRRPYM
jgi:hypothetical protein